MNLFEFFPPVFQHLWQMTIWDTRTSTWTGRGNSWRIVFSPLSDLLFAVHSDGAHLSRSSLVILDVLSLISTALWSLVVQSSFTFHFPMNQFMEDDTKVTSIYESCAIQKMDSSSALLMILKSNARWGLRIFFIDFFSVCDNVHLHLLLLLISLSSEHEASFRSARVFLYLITVLKIVWCNVEEEAACLHIMLCTKLRAKYHIDRWSSNPNPGYQSYHILLDIYTSYLSRTSWTMWRLCILLCSESYRSIVQVLLSRGWSKAHRDASNARTCRCASHNGNILRFPNSVPSWFKTRN